MPELTRTTILLSRLRPDRELDYERAHEVIPDDLMATLVSGGVRDWAIWRSGRDLLHLVDVDDYAELGRRLAGDAVNNRWQAEMAEYVEEFVTLEHVPALPELHLVWSLHRQRDQ